MVLTYGAGGATAALLVIGGCEYTHECVLRAVWMY
jgi:hypothetical protein